MAGPYCPKEHSLDPPTPMHGAAPEGFVRWLRSCKKCNRVFEKDLTEGTQPSSQSTAGWILRDRDDYPRNAPKRSDEPPT